MLQRIHRALGVLTLAFAVVAFMGGPLQAQSLDALRASGAVGERFDGYLAARDSSAQSFVNQVNAQRKQIYQKRAASQGVNAAEVGKVYAMEIIKDVAPGTWLQKPDGSWTQK